MADGAVRPILVVVPAPSLQLFLGVRKRQEPVGVQALGPQAPVEGFDEGIIRHDVVGAAVPLIFRSR